MNNKRRTIAIGLIMLGLIQAAQADRPNFVLMFTDDQGHGDLSYYGSDEVQTPAIDGLAATGVRLTSFYVAAPLCTPSRAALMTGCYPKRIDMATGSQVSVLVAGDSKGMQATKGPGSS